MRQENSRNLVRANKPFCSTCLLFNCLFGFHGTPEKMPQCRSKAISLMTQLYGRAD